MADNDKYLSFTGDEIDELLGQIKDVVLSSNKVAAYGAYRTSKQNALQQALLKSGINIKTANGQSVLGPGNIYIPSSTVKGVSFKSRRFE